MSEVRRNPAKRARRAAPLILLALVSAWACGGRSNELNDTPAAGGTSPRGGASSGGAAGSATAGTDATSGTSASGGSESGAGTGGNAGSTLGDAGDDASGGTSTAAGGTSNGGEPSSGGAGIAGTSATAGSNSGGTAGSAGGAGTSAGGTSGVAGAVGEPGAECEEDADCEIADDCCDCRAQPKGAVGPVCAADCGTNACDLRGITAGAQCTLGRCTLAVTCDSRLVMCRAAAPECPEGHLPSVTDDSCWGPCIAATECSNVTGCAACPADTHCVRLAGFGSQYHCAARHPRCEPGNLCECLDPCDGYGCTETETEIACSCPFC